MIYTKWSNIIGYYVQRIVIGRENSCHCQTWLERRSLWNENLQRKQKWTAKATNLKENAGKKLSQFLSSEQPCEPKSLELPWKLQKWKNTLGKLVVAVNLEATWFEFEWKEPKWRWIFLTSVVGDSQISMIDIFELRYRWPWGVLSLLLCPEMDRNIRTGKQGYVFILSDFKVSW